MKRLLAIQHLRIQWTKAERGAHGGAARNALPRELPFEAPGASKKGWLHGVSFDARDDYRQVEVWDDLATAEAWRVPIVTSVDGGHLRVRVTVPIHVPARPHLDGWIGRLPLGQRLSFRVNSRADGDHNRWYVEDHLHIGWAETCTLDLPLFREIDERVLLY